MASRTHRWTSLAGLVALAGVLFAGQSAKAETVYIKNDTEVAVVVNVSTVVAGKVVRDRPVLIAPGKTGVILVPGNRVVQVSDAKLQRPLYNGIIPADTSDVHYLLKMDGPTKGTLEKK